MKVFVLFLVCCTSNVIGKKMVELPEVGLNLEELADFYGFPIETHEITTEDGYILNINHFLQNKDSKGVVMMVPCLLCPASVFMIGGLNGSLAFRLIDEGYDVWLVNYRGTTYSRKHLTLDPDEDKEDFWDYSYHEIGYYDVPASMEFILEQTGVEKLFYVGYSQGTTSFFVMASTKPTYNEKIRLAVELAPVAYKGNTPSELSRFMAENLEVINELFGQLDIHEMLPHWRFLTELGREMCSDGSELQFVCSDIIGMVGGVNEKELNKTMLPLITSHFPGGSSWRQMEHFLQGIKSDEFRQFDFGVRQNVIKYGQEEPPSYDLNQISCPVALFYGANDEFAAEADVNRLSEALPNLILKHRVEDEEFGHLDFAWAIHLDSLVNKYVIDVMKNY